MSPSLTISVVYLYYRLELLTIRMNLFRKAVTEMAASIAHIANKLTEVADGSEVEWTSTEI